MLGVKSGRRGACAAASSRLKLYRGALYEKSFVGGVSDADFVHHHKRLWLINAASGSETPPTDFLCKAPTRCE